MTMTDSDRADELGIQQLRSFCYVFERQSYSAAARELGLAVPTVWEQVRAVEKRYSAVLFEKRGRRIVPNASATTLHELLRPLLTNLDSTFNLISQAKTPQIMTLVCGMRMMSEDLGASLQKFHETMPDVSLRLLHGDSQTAQRLVATDAADLALMLEPSPSELAPTVSFERAYENDYLAVFPKSYPIAAKTRLNLRDIIKFPLVLGHAGTSARQVFEQALHRERLADRMKVVAETDNSAFTVSCVRAGLGLGVFAGRPNGPLTQGLVTRTLRKELGQAYVVFVWKRGRNLPMSVKRLMELIRSLNTGFRREGRQIIASNLMNSIRCNP